MDVFYGICSILKMFRRMWMILSKERIKAISELLQYFIIHVVHKIEKCVSELWSLEVVYQKLS